MRREEEFALLLVVGVPDPPPPPHPPMRGLPRVPRSRDERDPTLRKGFSEEAM
jgi:hypothetical protein